jgi:hypothetical protein
MRSLRAARALAAVVTVALLLAAAAQASLAETPKRTFNTADQSAARAAVLKARDLGAGWRGGLKKATVQTPSSCPGWKPKQADLVVTGVAESEYSADGAYVYSSAQVYKTKKMVALDWRRTVTGMPMRCVSWEFAQGAGEKLKVISVKRMPFPKLAPYTARFRVVVDYDGNPAARMVIDAVGVGRGRTGVTIGLIAPYAQRAQADAAEVRLARLVLSRIKT